jgi:hypothetical protein
MRHAYHITSLSSTKPAVRLTSLIQKIIGDDIQGFDPTSIWINKRVFYSHARERTQRFSTLTARATHAWPFGDQTRSHIDKKIFILVFQGISILYSVSSTFIPLSPTCRAQAVLIIYEGNSKSKVSYV